MKKIIISVFLIFLASTDLSIIGQNTPTPGAPAGVGAPPGGSDKNLSEDLRKLRSVELERVKREAEKSGKSGSATAMTPAINSKVDTKFPEIKEDFEGMQISQTAIIKTFTTDKKIDYALIEISADNINKHAKRLDSNIFVEIVKKKDPATDETPKDAPEKTKSMRDMIVELDNAIGNFVSSKIFANLRVVDPEAAAKTRDDLVLIQVLSEKISAEAKKLK